MKRKYNTPKRNIIIMTRLNSNEKSEFDKLLDQSNLTQAEYLRQCIFKKKIVVKKQINEPVVLNDFKELVGNMGKIGSNINQIARHLNQDGIPQLIIKEITESLNQLNETRFYLLELMGRYYGNH